MSAERGKPEDRRAGRTSMASLRSLRAGPLEGIRVLDLSRILAGPFAAMLLGDLGADVIKVEIPGVGDDTREWGPPYLNGASSGESAYFACCNRNKRSVTVNMKDARGLAFIRQLAKQSDVVIENYRVGALDAMGLGYRDLSALNPNLIYASISGFGPDGPDADRGGYAVMVEGEGGLMSLTGPIGGAPVKCGVALTDLTTGMFTQSAVLAALFARTRLPAGTAGGQHIDLSLLETQVALLGNIASNYLNAGVEGRRWGTAHPSIVPYQLFPTADGHLLVGAGNDRQFRQLCKDILGAPHLAADERFAKNADRVRHRDELLATIGDIFIARNTDEWIAALRPTGLPYAPVNNMERVFSHPQVLHRNMVLEMPHPTAGKVRMTGFPYKFSETPATLRRAPPLLGQHTDEVLKECGYTDEQISSMRADKVV